MQSKIRSSQHLLSSCQQVNVHSHAVLNDLFASVIIPKPEEAKEVSIFLFHNEAVKHLFDICGYSGYSSLLKCSKTPKRLLFKSGPERRTSFKEIPCACALETKTTRI